MFKLCDILNLKFQFKGNKIPLEKNLHQYNVRKATT